MPPAEKGTCMSATTLSSLLLSLSALCYLACGALIIQRLSTPGQKGGIPLRLMTFVAFALHGAGLTVLFTADRPVMFGLALALSVTVFIAVAVFLVESIMRRVSGLMGVFLLCAAACAALPAVFPGHQVSEAVWTPLFRLHLLFAFSASGLMLIAVVQAVLLVLVQRQLKNPVSASSGAGFIANMPDLLAMERILYRIVLLGFMCLTLLVGLALMLNFEQHGNMLVISHRFFMTIVSWAVFAVLLYGRYVRGWRGRRALAWFWGGVCSLALSYFVYAAVLAVMG